MTFDRHGDIRITPQPIGLTGQDLLRFRGDIRSVKGEQYAIACARLQILLRSRNDVPRTDAAGATRWSRRPRGRLRRGAAASSEQQQRTEQTDYSRMHINPPSTGPDNIAALFTEARETKPDRKHPAGWLPRVDWSRSSRSSTGGENRHVRANRRATGENTSTPGRSVPRSVLRPENHASAAFPPSHPAASLQCRRIRHRSWYRRPDRGAVFSRTEADPLRSTALGTHDIELRGTAAIGIEDDLAAVGGIAGRRVDRLAVAQPCRPVGAQIKGEEIADAVLGTAQHHPVAVRGKARRKGHAREIADGLLLPGIDIEEINTR